MAEERLNVNPTRMELFALKRREKTAVRGHKLLKDKSDEMIRQFMVYVKNNKKLRDEVENDLSIIMSSFAMAKAISDDGAIRAALAIPTTQFDLDVSYQNIMSVNVPKIKVNEMAGVDKYPYAFSSITSELDDVIVKLFNLSSKLVELAEVEKACNMLADEIEKNRRRVNALEYVMIPQIQNTIKYITMKLDENERGNTVRLMKVKDMIRGEN